MIHYDFSLRNLNTFGLDVRCDRLITFSSLEELISLARSGELGGNDILVVGSGSNLLFTGDFHGTILHAENRSIIIEKEEGGIATVTCEAGVIWDDFVKWCVKNNYGGTENLSYIPGTTGACPVQNIGAYGAEAGNIISRVNAVDMRSGKELAFSNNDCRFGYRNSRFKEEPEAALIITSVTFELEKDPVEFNLDYGPVKEQVMILGNPSLSTVREAIISIRKEKLPDPSIKGNAGSFFKNPVISSGEYSRLKRDFEEIPSFRVNEEEVKIPAAWLIDKCGLKGEKYGDAAVHDKQPLVLVNNGNATAREIMELSRMVTDKVYGKFGIMLEPEVRLV